MAGCAVGGASSQLVVPAASAQQATTLPTWEVFCTRGGWDDIVAAAKKAGAERWEPVSHHADGTEYGVCMKRAK